MPRSAFWPPGLPEHFELPAGGLFANLARGAARRPDHVAIAYYGGEIRYRDLLDRTLRLAGHLRTHCGVGKGDRVVIDLQNSPHFVIAYYAALALGAVAVPVNPMNLGDELAHFRADSGARVAVIGRELVERFRTLDPAFQHVVVARYADAVAPDWGLPLPELVADGRKAEPPLPAGFTRWEDAIGGSAPIEPVTVAGGDLCLLPYTSGTTGKPKACRHSHDSVLFTAIGQALWYGFDDTTVTTGFMPLFHVAAMQASMNAGIYVGGTLVIMTRWDRELVPPLFQRHGVTFWNAAPAMIVDVLASPSFSEATFARLRTLTGGGAAMPAAVTATLKERFGLAYVEGYGLTETIAPTHINPPQRPKPQCLGIPFFETLSLVVDPETLTPVPDGSVGEILVSGPQVMAGYWNRPDADAEVFVEIEGRRYLRTGDLGTRDAEGYFHAVDRLKRMINLGGYKVWPAECEAKLYEHPAIQECCVVSAPDAKRGESVKAYVVLKPEARGKTRERDIIDWARGAMATYKAPRAVEFVEALPRSASNKIAWRALQDRAWGRAPT